MSEEEITRQIDLEQKRIEEITLNKKYLISQLFEQETAYGEAKLNLDSLKDQLRRLKLRTVSYEPTERELEIERFRSVLPDLLHKIGHNLES